MDLPKVSTNRDSHHNPAIFWALIILLMLILGGAVTMLGEPRDQAAFGSGSPVPSPTEMREPRFYTITYKSGVFSPTNLRIHSGDTVRFKNDSFFSIRIISDQTSNKIPMFDSVGDVPQGSYFSYTFSEKGIFGYHNNKNPDQQGTIIVR